MPALADFRFFIFIIPNMENQIRMPSAFSNLVWENMSNPVEVSTTNGQSWSISWVVEEEHPHRIVFTGGWRAFYEHYHLRIGATLLLSYHQPKFFNVAIYGTSFCEINYGSLPAIPTHGNYTVQFFVIIPVNDPDTLRSYNRNQLLGPCRAGDGLHLYKLSDGPQVNAHSRWVQIDQSVLSQANRTLPGIPFSRKICPRFQPNVPPLSRVYEDSPISITNERGVWTVQYTHYVGRTNGCFGVGWSALATACQLRHGHVCVVERLAPQDYRLHIY
ncbi:uncharacterized protein LOC107621348 [Arachis ipaensis]|uniref:uncharacterized protein LOC107621348 n=1 Tax=Arachis ipaensis TaxID=130454 RepID=UPI0007AFAD1B|nr:uncharacterized protein LOC107621348 [Arachis ipaensis]